MAGVAARLGILGGTFDPVHHGHLVAAQEARYRLGLRTVVLMPAGDPPHKPGRPLSAERHRWAMLELAIAGRPGLALSRVDLDRPGPHYSVEMLRLLRAEVGPGPQLFFVVGADSLRDLRSWLRPEEILEQCELAVVGRPGAEVDLADLCGDLPLLHSRLHWVEMPLLEISSTDIRRRVREGRPISFLVPPAVEAYIQEEGLYR